MTREAFAALIHWNAIIWFIGLVNVGAMLPQLVKLIRKPESAEGLALGMYITYFIIQVSFALEGYFRRNTMLMVCMLLSACVSIVVILLICLFRARSQNISRIKLS